MSTAKTLVGGPTRIPPPDKEPTPMQLPAEGFICDSPAHHPLYTRSITNASSSSLSQCETTIYPSHTQSYFWYNCLHQLVSQLRTSKSNPSTFSGLLITGYANSTSQTYARALDIFLKWLVSNFANTPPSFIQAVHEYLIHLSKPPKASHARVLLAALTFAAQADPHVPHFPQSCWAGARAIARTQPAPHRTWFFCTYFDPTVSHIPANLPAVFYGIMLLSFVYLLRVSEASAIVPGDIQRHTVAIRASKRNRSMYWRTVAPALECWTRFFMEYHPRPGCPYFGYDELQHDFKQFASDIDVGELTWHSLRRGAASTLVQIGINPENLIFCGRWRSYNSVL